MARVLRGQVVSAEIHGLHYFVVVSNNQRNAHLNTFLAVRMTSRNKATHLPTVVAKDRIDPPAGPGWVLCDDIIEIYYDEVIDVLGTMSWATITKIDDGLRVALAL